tara:strand:- start:28020 stop:29306 length:1287 start_codon:yes stop_codon:yes gene_type:complete
MSNAQKRFESAQKYIPGGVNSPVRAFKGVGGTPVFIERAKGAYIFDPDNKRYIDYIGSWGPMILGHAHPAVIDAVRSAAGNSLSFGAPTEIETTMAEKVCELMPSIEMIRMVSSGTEATMSAIRLARGFTGRDKIVKFEGCYHGHSDSLLVKAGSGALTLGEPSSPGVPKSLAENTITLQYNDENGVKETFSQIGDQIACIIVEPITGNMNCILPKKDFLKVMREECDRHGSLLIFDEVMTGFRVNLSGAQGIYGVKPDLTTLGKIIGGGMPVGAFGGKKEIMEQIAPLGPIYQAGTLSGNPVAMAAGLTTLRLISEPNFFDQLSLKVEKLVSGIISEAKNSNVPMTENHSGGMFGIFFTEQEKVNDFSGALSCNLDHFKKFFHGMLEEGIYFAPSIFEAGFLSAAHTDEDIDFTIQAARLVLNKISD